MWTPACLSFHPCRITHRTITLSSFHMNQGTAHYYLSSSLEQLSVFHKNGLLFYPFSSSTLTKGLASSEIAGSVFTLATVAVLPFYTLMVFAPKAELTQSGMVKMFSGEMTLASAWIHLLAVDLFAARQVFHDGLENRIETRHSVSLCLLFCPIGILTHVITKAMTKST